MTDAPASFSRSQSSFLPQAGAHGLASLQSSVSGTNNVTSMLASHHGSFLEALPEAVLIADASSRIVYANEIATAWLADKIGTPEGQTLAHFFGTDENLTDWCQTLAGLAGVTSGIPAQTACGTLTAKDGRQQKIRLSFRPFASEVGMVCLVVLEELPSQPRAEPLPPTQQTKVLEGLREVILEQTGCNEMPSGSAWVMRERQLVLLVDDESAMRDILGLHLQSRFDVITARNGLEGYQMACTHLPDLILSDIRMPVRNGLDLCRDVRLDPATRSIPMVMLTATDDQAMKLDCLAAGATDFLSKPCSAAELLLRVHNLTQIHRQQCELEAQKQRLEQALDQLRHQDQLLVQQERLASLGRMSAGIIHEINNPLNYTLQGLSLLHRVLPDLPPDKRADFQEILHDVEEGVGRVCRIVNDLRGFATSPKPSAYQPTELSAIIEMVLKHLSHEVREDYEIRLELADRLSVMADRHQLVQVLINLVKNALDAIAAKTYSDDEKPFLLLQSGQTHDRVYLRLRDNGIGMTAEVREHIFEPFFTTKEAGHGMGLGLSISHSILREHGAEVQVQSTAGEFTEFVILFSPQEDTSI